MPKIKKSLKPEYSTEKTIKVVSKTVSEQDMIIKDLISLIKLNNSIAQNVDV